MITFIWKHTCDVTCSGKGFCSYAVMMAVDWWEDSSCEQCDTENSMTNKHHPIIEYVDYLFDSQKMKTCFDCHMYKLALKDCIQQTNKKLNQHHFTNIPVILVNYIICKSYQICQDHLWCHTFWRKLACFSEFLRHDVCGLR